MSSLLIGVSEHRPEIGDGGALGALSVVEVDLPGRKLFAVIATDDVDWRDAPLDEVEWIGPRAIAFDGVLRGCVPANVLPLRFGTAFDTEASLIEHVRTNGASLVAGLVRFRDVDEYRLRLSLTRPGGAEATSGADYLRRRRNAHIEGDVVLDALIGILRDWASDLVVTDRKERGLDAAVLCDAECWPILLDRLARLSARIEFEGPLPPFHFADLAAVDGG